MAEVEGATTPPRRGPGRPSRSSEEKPASARRSRLTKRTLDDVLGDREVPEAKKARSRPASAATPAAQPAQVDAAMIAHVVTEFRPEFDLHAMPQDTRERIAPLLHRWGKARAEQILHLWTFLGDGASRPVSASTLQVWGPPGTGKSAVVSDYLSTLGIRHIRLNAATFTSLSELNARLAELLRRATVKAVGSDIGELPIGQQLSLQRSMPVSQTVRSLDKLEAFVRVPLQTLSRTSLNETDAPSGLLPASDCNPADGPVKVVVVIDQAQELPRLGAGAIELLVNLPEVLQWGNELAVVAVGRLRLSSLGLHPNREPPSVAFQAYTEEEAQDALSKVLAQEFPSIQDDQGQSGAQVIVRLEPGEVCRGLMKFAWPHLARNLQQLLSVGRQLLREGVPDGEAGGSCGADFQKRVFKAVQQRLGVCDLSGLLKSTDNSKQYIDKTGEGMDTASVSALVMLRQMTKAEMRLILAAYLAGYVEKEDDVQLFMPGAKRKARRKPTTKQQQAEAQPVYSRPARPTSLSRLLAVYHRLARRPQLLGPPLFEHLAGLKEAGLLRFPAERACLDHDVKVTCRAQLPLVRAIAGELNIDLAEYLTKY